MTDQKTEQKPADHKAIREALEASEREWRVSCFVVGSDLRALLADLDAMRADAQRYRYLRDVAWGDGSLVYFDHRYDKDEWDGKIDAAHAALKGAEA